MSKLSSIDFLKKISFEDLMNIYRRCKAKPGAESEQILALIEGHKILFPISGGLPGDHPVIEEMRVILLRPDIREALKIAAAAELPALSAVDEVFKQEIGFYYGQFDTASWAGALVADEMRRMGYKEKSKKSLPAGSVIKTGAVFC